MADTTIDFIMGKGGVGRSTVSRLLAHHYSARGESTIIVECNDCKDIPACYNKPSQGYTPTHLAEGIDAISVSPMAAIEDYVVLQLKMRKLYELIFDNRLVKPLIEAAPGLHDAVQLGKIYDLQISGQWDRIVVDCPATGHGIALISAAKTMMDVSRRGPLYNQSKLVEDVVREHGRVVMVTLPEELPVRETLQLWNTMRTDFRPKTLGIIVNQWQHVSPTLQEAFNRSQVPSMLEDHPEYQTVFNILKEDHEHQILWRDWLGTHLCTPQDLSILRYDKWSHETDLPPLDGLETWL